MEIEEGRGKMYIEEEEQEKFNMEIKQRKKLDIEEEEDGKIKIEIKEKGGKMEIEVEQEEKEGGGGKIEIKEEEVGCKMEIEEEKEEAGEGKMEIEEKEGGRDKMQIEIDTSWFAVRAPTTGPMTKNILVLTKRIQNEMLEIN